MMRRRRVPRPVARSEYATAKQTIALPNDTVNTVFKLNSMNLGQFDRLSALGRCYQYFRFTKIELKFTPFSDTFAQAGAASVPYFYYVINKSDTLDAGTFNKLRDAGAKAIRFDDKTVTVAWKPVVSNLTIGAQPVAGPPISTAWASYRTSPWLSTEQNPADGGLAWNPSEVPHKGILYGVEQDITSAPGSYGVTMTIYAEFKKPLTYDTNTGETDPGATFKVVESKAAIAPPV